MFRPEIERKQPQRARSWLRIGATMSPQTYRSGPALRVVAAYRSALVPNTANRKMAATAEGGDRCGDALTSLPSSAAISASIAFASASSFAVWQARLQATTHTHRCMEATALLP